MVGSLFEIFKREKIFIFQRVSFLLLAFLLSTKFSTDWYLIQFVKIEPVVSIISLSYFSFNNRLISYSILVIFLFVSLLIIPSLIAFVLFVEIIKQVCSYRVSRKVNLLLQSSFSFLMVIIVLVNSDIYDVYIIWVLLSLPVVIFSLMSSHKINRVNTRTHQYAIMRNIGTIGFRSILFSEEVIPLLYLMVKIINQAILYFWSFIKSTDKLEIGLDIGWLSNRLLFSLIIISLFSLLSSEVILVVMGLTIFMGSFLILEIRKDYGE